MPAALTALVDSPIDLTGEVTVLACPGPRFAGGTAVRFHMDATAACGTDPYLVLDLGAVAALDATGLKVVAALARRCRENGGELMLCGATRPVRALLAAAGVNQLAEVYDSRRQAVLAAKCA